MQERYWEQSLGGSQREGLAYCSSDRNLERDKTLNWRDCAFYLGNSTPEREWLLGMTERAIYSLTQVSFSEGPELSESLWN